jgi:ATP-dependent Clp protease ATP-binding subunit ClpB
MDLQRLTLKSQEALSSAQRLAGDKNHSQIEPGHLLLALLTQPEGVVLPLMQKLGVSPRVLTRSIEDLVDRNPSVYGPTETYFSRDLRDLLE